MSLFSCVSHHFLSIVIPRKVLWGLESKSHMEWWVIFLLILTATCIGNKETCLYNPCETSMQTSAYATYKCNMCNTSIKHVKHHGGTLETCTWQQHFETLETRLWNKHCNYSDFYVSMDVRPIFLCNLCTVYMFSLYNTLTTLRTYNGTMFMLIILPNYVSKWWLTKQGPLEHFCLTN
jgi:hypothetical protein